MPVSAWMGQYMQGPVSDEGRSSSASGGRIGRSIGPPACDLVVVQAWDTAYSDKETANRSAMITWGEFCCYDPTDISRKIRGIILFDAWAGRVNFPKLKQKAREFYEQHRPHSLIIESKATGPPLIQELRKAGLYVDQVAAHRGHDKHTKTNAVADMF
jgi:phage terminase large subunit-like protein